MDSGLPSGNSLAKEIRYKLRPEHLARIQAWESENTPRTAGIEYIAQICKEIDGNHDRLIQAIPRGEWLNASPHEGHRVLAELWAEGMANEPLTTNMDTLIEKGFGDVLGREASACSRPEHFRRRQEPHVYKLHGCLHEEFATIWSVDELERRDWDPAWKAHVTANILMQAEAFVFIGFRMKLPYLLKVFKEAGEPRTYMVNPEPYEKFRDDPENPQNAEFLAAFQIGPQRYIQATAREFFEALRPRVHESNLEHQVMVELPRDLQAFGVSRELEPVSEELLNRLKDCQPSEFQRMLKRSLLGSHYIPLASDGTRETLQSLLLLGTAFPIEVARDRSEPVCYLVRNGARHPLFVARSGEKKPYTSMVVALWRNRAENQWPTDLNPLLVQRPLVIIHGQGPLMIPGGLINIADGKGMPGPYGESREFVYLRHDELVGCLNAKNLAATAESVRQLMETRLGGAQA